MSLIWLYFFWEVTSVCSFLLIGYTGSKEAIDNSFRALWMNLLGGLGIAIISTNKGIMTDKEARKANVGGEVLAFVW